MGKREKSIIGRRIVRSYISSIISISLVLFLVGFFAVLAVNAREVSDYFKENIKISTILKEDATEVQAESFCKNVAMLPAVKSTHLVTKEQGTKEMKELLGEDFLDVFESNPIPISIEIQLNPAYFHPDSVKVLKNLLVHDSLVEDVVYQDSLIETINKNMQKIGLVLMVFIVLLMFISTVLINNTVRLNVFSKRFSIHTMQLVGATKGFIRRPFLYRSIYQGLISGVIALAALVSVLFVVKNEFSNLFNIVNLQVMLAVSAGVIVLGVVICLVCTFFVVNKLISLSGSDLYF